MQMTAVQPKQGTGGDYRPQSVIVTEIRPQTPYTNGTASGQVQSFTVRKEQSFTDANGTFQERQPLDLWCTTFNTTVMQALTTITVGDKIDLVGFLEPSWRGYVADNSPDGDRFVIPDSGRQPVTSPKGRTIQPSATPFRAEKGVPNFVCYDVKQVRVNELTPTTTVETATIESGSGDPLAAAQNAMNAATAPEQPAPTTEQAHPHEQAAAAPPNPNNQVPV